MSKQVKELGGSTTAAYKIDPSIPVIYGYDRPAPKGTFLVESDKARLTADKALILNIVDNGVLEPIRCMLTTDDEGESLLVVVDGRRRTIAARAANERLAEDGKDLIDIPFVLESGGDKPERLLTMVSANSFSREHAPMEQARKAKAMLDSGLDRKQVAHAFGFTKMTLGNRLKLLELPKTVQTQVDNGGLSVTAALELSKETPERAEEIAAEVAAKSKGRKSGQTKRVKAATAGETADEGPKPPTRQQLRKLLETEEFAACSTDTQKTVRWMIGDLKTPRAIPGLNEAWRAVQGMKKAPAPPAE